MKSAALLAVFGLLYAAVVVPHFGVGYQDFGDGNYLYISRRLADGLVLYRDILAPQPPCHLLAGAALMRLGRLFGNGPEAQLYTVRMFSLLLHLATMLVVWAIARLLFRRAAAALWAAGLYLVIPLGFWWNLSYESEPLEMFFLLLSFLFVLRWKPWALAVGGLIGALAVLTNMTAVCYVGWVALFLLVSDWRRALQYVAPAAAVVGAAIGLGEWMSGGRYLENVLYNQVGTFPHPDILQTFPPDAPLRGIRTVLDYALTKVAREGGDVLNLDGVFISAAIVGMLLYLGKGNDACSRRRKEADLSADQQIFEEEAAGCQPAPPYHRSFVGWYGFWSLMAIGFVSKGATEDYIFSIGEPFVCLFAAYAITEIGKSLSMPSTSPAASISVSASLRRRLHLVAIAAVGLVVLFARPALWIYDVVHREQHHELRAADAQTVRHLIEQHSKPGDAILAAPYYAFISQRNLIEEFSELFIWDIKYLIEQHVNKEPGVATQKTAAIADALRRKAVPVVVANFRPSQTGYVPMQIFGVPEVRQALQRNYRSALPQPLRGLNAYVDVLIPN